MSDDALLKVSFRPTDAIRLKDDDRLVKLSDAQRVLQDIVSERDRLQKIADGDDPTWVTVSRSMLAHLERESGLDEDGLKAERDRFRQERDDLERRYTESYIAGMGLEGQLHEVIAERDRLKAQLDRPEAEEGARSDVPTCAHCGADCRLHRKFNNGNPVNLWLPECDCEDRIAEEETDAWLERRTTTEPDAWAWTCGCGWITTLPICRACGMVRPPRFTVEDVENAEERECEVCLRPVMVPTESVTVELRAGDVRCSVIFCRDCVSAVFQDMASRWNRAVEEQNLAVEQMKSWLGLSAEKTNSPFRCHHGRLGTQTCPFCEAGVEDATCTTLGHDDVPAVGDALTELPDERRYPYCQECLRGLGSEYEPIHWIAEETH